MFRILRENFILKLISLAASVMIWQYVRLERNPEERKVVMAEVRLVGQTPKDLIVNIPQGPIGVEVIGPRSELDRIADNDIKAEIDLGLITANTTQVRIRYVRPPRAQNVIINPQRQTLPVEVAQRARRRMRITAYFENQPGPGLRYEPPLLNPEYADVVGSQEEVARVSKLVVFVKTAGTGLRADLPIKALDKDNVEVEDVTLEPASTQVELRLVEAPSTMTKVVSVSFRGHAAPGYVITDITAVPDQVVVMGNAEQLRQMTNVPTAEINLDGINADLKQSVRLVLPPGVTVRDGRESVTVTVKVHEIPKPNP